MLLFESLGYNVATLVKHPLGELAGSLGDLGTLLPIMTALTSAHSISLTPTLIFAGIFNILSGAYFGVPIVVQPMKAIASISLARKLTLEETMGAGIGVGVVIFLLSVTKLLHRLANITPVPIVKGIQIGAGLSLVLNAGTTLAGLDNGATRWDDNIFWATGAFIVLYGTSRVPRFPFALLVFSLGILFAMVQLAKNGENMPKLGIYMPFVPIIPLPNDFANGFGTAGIAQIPLTILNSIIAVTALSEDLLPDRTAPSVTALGLSVAVMNLSGCWFGAMPVCHGSGGLAGQYRFGARSGASVMILGIVKVLIGVFLGDSLQGLFELFPKSFLGIMVFAAGMELASVGQTLNTTAKDIYDDPQLPLTTRKLMTEKEQSERWMVMMVTVGMLIAFRNALAGFLAGFLVSGLFKMQNRVEEKFRNDERVGIIDETSRLLGHR